MQAILRSARRGRSDARLSQFVGTAYALLAVVGVHAQAEESPTTSADNTPDTIFVVRERLDLSADYAGGQVGSGGRVGVLGNQSFMDSAFTVTSYTEQLIRDLQAHSVADVMQADAAVRVARGFGNFQELYVVRGFPVYSDDLSYNGLYGVLPRQYVAAELIERVEVFRGANTFVNGAAPGGSGIGGAVNLVPKHARAEDTSRATLGFEGESLGLGAGDFSRRFGADRSLGIRINAVHRDGEGAIERDERRLSAGTIAVDRVSQRARVSLDIGKQDSRLAQPRPSVTPTGAAPPPPDSETSFAQPWTTTEDDNTFGVLRGDYDATPRVALWAALGARDGTERNVLANPTADARGGLRGARFENYREDRVATGELGLRSDVRIGAVKHQLVLSATALELESRNAFRTSSAVSWPGDLYNPGEVAVPADVRSGGQFSAPLVTSEVRTRSLAVGDLLSFSDDRVLVTLGARYQVIEQYGYDYNFGLSTSAYDRSATTPIATVVVKPSQRVAVYANAVEALTQGGIAPLVLGSVSVSNGGEIMSPFRSKQREIGFKYDGGQFGAAIAAFRLEMPSALLDGTVFRTDGAQVNEGLELSWYGQPLPQLRVLGGITLLDAATTRTQAGQYDGKRAIGVPRTQASAGFDWGLPAVAGLRLDGRVVYTGSQMIDAANTANIPSWTRLDVGARYEFALVRRRATVRANIANATDESDWISAGGSPGANYLVLGQPRTFVFSLSLDL